MALRHPVRTAVLLLMLCVLAAVLFLRSRYAWDHACAIARAQLPSLLGMQVEIGRCEVNPITQSVSLHQVVAVSPDGKSTRFAADLVEIGFGGLQPWLGRLELTRVAVVRPRLTVDLSAARAPGAKGRGSQDCALQGLQNVVVDALEIRRAQLQLLFPAGRKAEVDGLNLRWTTHHGVARYAVDSSEGALTLAAGGPEYALAGLHAEGGFDASRLELEVTQGELALDDANLAFTGRVEQLCRPILDADAQLFLPVRTLLKAVERHPPASGHLWAHLSVSGRLSAPLASADVVGTGLSYGDLHPGDFTGRVTLAGSTLTVHDLAVASGQGTAKLTATVHLVPGLPVVASAELTQASLGHLLERAGLPGSWVELAATGRAEAQGRLLPTVELKGAGQITVRDFRLTSHPFDQPLRTKERILAFDEAAVRGTFLVAQNRVEVSEATVESRRNRLRGRAILYFDTQEGMEIQAHSDELDLGELQQVAGIPMGGRGSGELYLSGPYPKPTIHALASLRELKLWDLSLGVAQGRVEYADHHLRFPGVSGQKGKTLYFGAVDLDFTAPKLVLRADLRMPQGRLEDLADCLAGESRFFDLMADGALTGDFSGRLAFDSPASSLTGEADLALSDAAYDGRRLGSGKLKVRFVDGESIVLDPLRLAGPMGVLTADGHYAFDDGALDYRFRLDNLSLQEAAGPALADRLGVGGKVALVGKVEGNSDVPVLSAYLTGPKLLLSGRSMGSVQLEGRMQGRDLQIWGRPFGDTHGVAHVTLRSPLPYELNLELALGDLEPFLPRLAASQGLSGSAIGKLQASGAVLDWSRFQGEVTLSSLTLARGDFVGRNVGPVHLRYAQGRFEMDPLEFSGPNTQLSLAGWVAPQAMDLRMKGSVDMRLLESFVPSLERASGMVELAAAVGGSPQDPSLLGGAELHEASLTLRALPLEVRDLSGRIQFSASRILIDDLQGVLNDGRLAVRGDVRLARFQVSQVDLGAQLDEVRLRLADDLPFTTTGELLLAGHPGALLLSGDLDVEKLRYERPFELDSLLPGFGHSSGPVLSPAAPPPEWLSLDVGLHLKDAHIDNNVARAKLLGNLKITGTNAHPALAGTIEAGEGSQAYFRGNQFNVTQGLVEFKGQDALDSVFDVHAETQVREYLIRLHAFGRPDKPQVILDSDANLSEADILSLLTIGVTSHDKTDTTLTGAGLAAEALLNASGLDRQVQRFLPKNALLKDLSFHIASSYNDATGLSEPTAQLESKFLIDQLKLRMSQPISGHGTRAQAEYRFDNKLSLQAQWDNEDIDYASPNLGLDLKLRWEDE